MRRFLILSAAAIGLMGAAQSDKPEYFVRSAKSVADCHAQYDTLAPGWHLRRSFIVSKRGAGEHVVNCMPDGVAEYLCDPASGRFTGATMAGGTLKDCKPFYPHMPFTLKGNLLPN